MAQQSSCASHFRPSRAEVVRDRHELVRHLDAQGVWPRYGHQGGASGRLGSKRNAWYWYTDSDQCSALAKRRGRLAAKADPSGLKTDYGLTPPGESVRGLAARKRNSLSHTIQE